MKHIIFTSIFTATLLAACGEASHDGHDMAKGEMAQMTVFKSGAMTAENVMLRPPLPGRSTAMASLSLTNTSEVDDVLIAIESPLSDSIELHTILMEGEVRKMRRLENGLALPKAETVILKGGADHVMIFDAEIAKDTKRIPMTLVFKTAQPLEVMASVNDGSGDHSGH